MYLDKEIELLPQRVVERRMVMKRIVDIGSFRARIIVTSDKRNRNMERFIIKINSLKKMYVNITETLTLDSFYVRLWDILWYLDDDTVPQTIYNNVMDMISELRKEDGYERDN